MMEDTTKSNKEDLKHFKKYLKTKSMKQQDAKKEETGEKESTDFSSYEEGYTKVNNNAMIYKQEKLEELYAKYDYFFAQDKDPLTNIPVGWIGQLEKVLNIFAASGMSIVIKGISIEDGRLYMHFDGNYNEHTRTFHGGKPSPLHKHMLAAQEMMRSLIKSIPPVCILCGTPCGKAEDRKSALLCDSCESIFGLSPEIEEEEDMRF